MSINQRVETRTATALEGVVHMSGDTIACHLKDISSKGAKLVCVSPLTVGANVSLALAPFGSILAEVAWCSENTAGLKFKDSPQAVEQVLLGLASYAML